MSSSNTSLKPAALEVSTPEVAEQPNKWILGPTFDLLFVCGGLPLILIALNALTIGWKIPDNTEGMQSWVLLLVLVGQHLFADAHNAATYVRIFRGNEDRARFKFYRTSLVYIALALFVVGLLIPRFTGVMVYLYLITVFWHYAAQTFGIALIYCYKRKYRMTTVERWIFRKFIHSLCAYAILRFISLADLKSWFGVPVPFWGPLPPIILNISGMAFSLFALAFVFVIVRKALVERSIFPLPAALLVITICCLGFSQGMTNAMMWFYVPAFFHGSQYIAVCLSYYLKERGVSRGAKLSEIIPLIRGGEALLYIGSVVLMGAFFYVAIPFVFRMFGYDIALVAGLVLAVVNFHHFVTDAAIWRLRDPRCREILVA